MREDPTAIVPPEIVAAGHCACGARLHRAETGWVCPRGLDHTPIYSDESMAAKLAPVLPVKRPEKMGPHTWGWYRRRRAEWALRIINELRQRSHPPKRGGPQASSKRSMTCPTSE